MRYGTIYRVEHAVSGHGPYRHYDGLDRLVQLPISRRLNRAHGSMFSHPSPSADPGLRPGAVDPFEFCGFSNMRMLFSWFGGWLPQLLRSGFTIRVYRCVAITRESNFQALFYKPER